MLIFKVPGLPPSYNKHFKINHNLRQVYLSAEARGYKIRVKLTMPPWEGEVKGIFRLSIVYHANWFFKNNKIRKIDIQNLDKLLIDAISEKMGINDSQFFEIYLSKKQNDVECFTEIKIERLKV